MVLGATFSRAATWVVLQFICSSNATVNAFVTSLDARIS